MTSQPVRFMNHIHRVATLSLALALLGPGSAFTFGDQEPDDPEVSFALHVHRILSDKCFACHGPDEHARQADLRLDIREQALEAGAWEPGQPAESEAMRRMLSDDPDRHMPPAESLKELSKDEIEIIRKWIAGGAQYETHWAYRPLERPKVPAIKHARIRNPIDSFILDALNKTKLDLAPEAGKVTLIRRLYLDLLGVPPAPAEVDAFVADQSADAWDKLVDRLLNDKRFGERMAVYWLDLVRYADTIGYHSDTYMEVSAYRDYVIDAFNQNKPFDQFTIEQLAGDLLPEPTVSQRVASGYNRLLQTTEEGGAQAKEYMAIYAADRVRNVSGVWLGATVGCAQCHDHKYDPITSRDFYSLAAFFADIKEKAIGKRQPNLKLYREDQKVRIESLKTKIASLQLPQLLNVDSQLVSRLAAGQEKWEQSAIASADKSLWTTPEPASVEATGGVILKRQPDGSLLSTSGNPATGNYSVILPATGVVHAVRIESMPDASFPRKTGFSRGNGNFVLTGLELKVDGMSVKISGASASYEQNGWPVLHAIDENKTSGWAVDGHQKDANDHVAVFKLQEPIDFGDQPGRVQIEMRHDSIYPQHLIGRFRLSLSDQPDAGLDSVAVPADILATLRIPKADRSADQVKQLADHYNSFAAELVPLKQALADAVKELADLEKNVQTTLVTETVAEPRMTRILPRGNWLDESGEVVQPAVLAFLANEKVEGRRANRLDLAKWIVDDRNPLTSRTFMNRLWKIYFGRGLSRNLDDLGGQGEPPTHPELLDWLSVEFRASGWDVKHMVRLLVTSSTYTQSSIPSPQARARDPENFWCARQGRWRVEAEFVRDIALEVSGLLRTEKTGGRSVKPYQPAGYWQHLNFPQRQWKADQDDGLYRRSLYTFWCRTFLHPSMLAFDAPSREECAAERARSNIPQQALVLLNDPMFVEAARVFAERIVRGESGVEERIAWAFRQALSRDPRAEELQLLNSLLQSQQARFKHSPADAKSLLSVGAAPVATDIDAAELAAWTEVARAIINAYETTSRF